MSLVVSRRAVSAAGRPSVVGVAVASLYLFGVIVAAIFPSILAPFDPLDADSSRSLLAPGAEHFFGTDLAGRDVFSRVVYGASYSVLVGFGAPAFAVFGGWPLVRPRVLPHGSLMAPCLECCRSPWRFPNFFLLCL